MTEFISSIQTWPQAFAAVGISFAFVAGLIVLFYFFAKSITD